MLGASLAMLVLVSGFVAFGSWPGSKRATDVDQLVLKQATTDKAQAVRVRADAIASERKLAWVHPYDDPHIIAGQGTIALEMLEEAPELDVLVIPIGGGGLIAGNAIAARGLRPSIEIVGVECALYPSMLNALKGEQRPIGGATIRYDGGKVPETPPSRTPLPAMRWPEERAGVT